MPKIIVVQNKVALGPNKLLEDDTPAYLSTKPQPYCARQGCKVPGTEMQSGAVLAVTCFIHGPEMVNYNLDAPEAARNPNRAVSRIWYWASFPDGRSGYLSEIYVEARYRGGLGATPM